MSRSDDFELKTNSDDKGVSEEEIALHMIRAEQVLNEINMKTVNKGESCSNSEGK